MADVLWGEEPAIALALLSATELLSGPAGRGWEICGVRNNLPQLQRC